MENEILLATSDGFYYEGVPSTSSIKTTKKPSLEDAMMYSNSTNDVSTATRIAIEKINVGVGAVRIILMLVALLLVIKGSLNLIKNKNIKIKNINSNEGPIDFINEDETNVRKKGVMGYYILAIILIAFVNVLKIAIS